MTLAANALTTVEAVADDLGITPIGAADVARLARLINTASSAIERFLRRDLQSKSHVERLAYSGGLRVVLEGAPLLSIESVVDDGETVDPARYAIEDADAGVVIFDVPQVRSSDLWLGVLADGVPGTGKRQLVVTYTGGYVLPNAAGVRTLPVDLEQACLLTVVSLYRSRGADRRIASESVGDASVTYAGVNLAAGRGEGGIIPDEAVVLLRPYARVSVV